MYSIGLYFDEETDRLIRKVWTTLAEKGLADYYHLSANRPHITMGIFSETIVEKAVEVLEQTTRTRKSFTLSFQHIGIFSTLEPTIFWGIVVTKDLLDFHYQLVSSMDHFSAKADYDFYEPDHWIPHCGLAMEVKNRSCVPKIVEICQILPKPHSTLVTEIGLISFRPVKQLCSFPFRTQSIISN